MKSYIYIYIYIYLLYLNPQVETLNSGDNLVTDFTQVRVEEL